jgi:hypothetical protein
MERSLRAAIPAIPAVFAGILASACTTGAPAPAGARTVAAARMPGPLQHVVLVELTDKSEIAAMKAESDRLLPQIPSVRGYACGTPVDIGRGNVAKDYDLGIVVQFDDVAGYRDYLEHPIHVELVQRWRPKWRRSYIVDFAP